VAYDDGRGELWGIYPKRVQTVIKENKEIQQVLLNKCF